MRLAAACLMLVSLALLSSAMAETPPRPIYPDAKSAYPYQLKVTDAYGAEGFGFDYYVGADSLTVVAWNDFGRPAKEVFRKVFTREEAKHWATVLTRVPLASLSSEYVDSRVDDGLQMTFDFRIAGKPPKRIRLANQSQSDLEALCRELNTMLPEKIRSRGARSSVRAQ